uniref:Uncharacterized protein n=1 Tax=Arundo donax TaxID=35708 RepID=A0A0A9BAX5_ARUDO
MGSRDAGRHLKKIGDEESIPLWDDNS